MGIPITEEQRIVIRLVKQARAVDRGYRALAVSWWPTGTRL